MDEPYKHIADLIKPRPTTVWGLDFFPDLEPDIPNNQDHPQVLWVSTQEVTDGNLDVVRSVVSEMGDSLRSIVEIGVNRNGERSMSRILMDERPKGSFYLGIDIDDKSYLDDIDANTWTLRTTSHDQDKVRRFLYDLKIKEIDLLFIDGWHSVDSCVNDWKYADLLSTHGAVVLHDTNSHPGCVALFEAVNGDMFSKQRFCMENDFGIAVFKRKT